MMEQSVTQFLPRTQTITPAPGGERERPIPAEPSKGNGQPLASLVIDGEPRRREPNRRAWRIRRAIFWRLALYAVVFDILIASLIGGLRLRAWVWDYTASGTRPLRSGDIQNAYHWGLIVYNNAAGDQNVDWRGRRSPSSWGRFFRAYLNVYDEIEQSAAEGRYGLDYAPGRLLVMAVWTRHVRAVYPLITTWQPQYAYSAPVVRFNTTCELIAAVGAFFLVRYWVKRGKMREWTPARNGWRGISTDPPISALESPPSAISSATIAGLAAALLIWFNPGTLVDAHVWPQWDVWVMPFYLWALYLASSNRWFIAGAVFGVGIMFKGQILFATPLLILWPLFEGRPLSSLRFVIGFVSAVAIVTCGWLVNRPEAWIWVATVAGITILVLCARRVGSPHLAATRLSSSKSGHARRVTFRLSIALALSLLVLWPWARHLRPPTMTLLAAFALAAIVSSVAFVPKKFVPIVIAAAFAGSIFSAGWMFHGSRGWFDLGFGYGTYKHLAMSNNSSNLPALLAAPPYDWHLPDVVFTLNVPWLHLHWPVPMRSALALSYFAAVVLCSIGAAIKSRRNDPQILIAFVAPWILLFALLPQMHQRYLVWGAVFSATMVGVSRGMTLMHLLLTALATATIFNQLLNSDPDFAPAIHRTIAGFFPSMGWLIALCAAVFLYRAAAGASDGMTTDGR